MFCTRCGATRTESDRFCARCGLALDAAAPAPAPPTKKRGGRLAGVVVAVVIAGGIAALLVFGSSGSKSGGKPAQLPPPPAIEKTSVHTIGPEGGVATDGATLRFPAGALAQNTEVRIGVLGAAPRSPDHNLVLLSPVYDLEAGPGAFAADVEVAIPYDAARIPAGRSADELVGVIATDTGYRRIKPAAIDPGKQVVTLRLPHFSRPAIAVLASPSRIIKSHPQLPFDIAVVDAYPPRNPALVDKIYRSIETAYRKLTIHGTRSDPFPAPPHDGAGESNRLLIEITSLDYLQSQYAAGFTPDGVAHSHDLLQIDHRALPDGPPWEAAIHEFFHVIQWTVRERAIFLGAPGRWSGFIAEATAPWAANVLVPPRGADVPEAPADFCFTELTYDPFALRQADIGHAYQAAIFMHHLTSRLGAGAVNRVLAHAFQPVADDAEALDRAIKEQSGDKESLASMYREFVIDFMFHKQFGERRIYGGKPDVLTVPRDRVTAHDLGPSGDQPAELTEILAARAYQVPRVLKLSPKVARDLSQQLSLAVTGQGWLWAIAEGRDGAQTLLGGGTSVSARIDDTVAAVWLLPVSFANGELTVTARLSATTSLSWKLVRVDLDPPGGNMSEGDYLSTVKGTVTETSVSFTTVFTSGSHYQTSFGWTRPPDRLVENQPFALEVWGQVSGTHSAPGMGFSSFFKMTEGLNSAAGFDVVGKPPSTAMFLPLTVSIGNGPGKPSDRASGEFIPIKSRDKLSDNSTLEIDYAATYGRGATYVYQLER